LAADGGGPGKDYMTYLKAVQNKDGAALRKMAEIPAGTSDKELREQMEMMSAMTPTDQKIVSATTNKDTAVLKVTGRMEGKKQYGTIEMGKKGGVWKITKEDWSEKEKK
jgi:predicted DNA-binding ArsR family transcriptional regulator